MNDEFDGFIDIDEPSFDEWFKELKRLAEETHWGSVGPSWQWRCFYSGGYSPLRALNMTLGV